METLPAVLQGFTGKGNIPGPAIWNAGNSWRRFVFQVDAGEYRQQGGLPSRLMMASVVPFRFRTTGAFSTAFWLISVCFGKTVIGMDDRIQSENDVNGVPVVEGHLGSR